MIKKFFALFILALLLTGCGAAPVPETAPADEAPAQPATLAPTNAPTETALPEPTATLASTEAPADPSLFGFISTADAPQGFMLEPVAQVIFEAQMQKRVDAGEIGGVQVEALSIVPRGDGTFFAEIFYAVQADASFWPEDFGTPDADGWVRTKCTRFDFESKEDGYYLKNKAVCN